jgi:hypothetical protein
MSVRKIPPFPPFRKGRNSSPTIGLLDNPQLPLSDALTLGQSGYGIVAAVRIMIAHFFPITCNAELAANCLSALPMMMALTRGAG